MITLIRHAPSTFNVLGTLTRDPPIYDPMQADVLNGSYDLVICSTLKRTRQTLDASNIIYSKVIFTDLCREHRDNNPINLFNGEPNTELVETHENLLLRVKEFKTMLYELSKTYNKIAVISHGVFLWWLCGHSFHNCEQYEVKF
jgi:broad specificity phosphatase PhoE